MGPAARSTGRGRAATTMVYIDGWRIKDLKNRGDNIWEVRKK
jgi:hypothetical protein